MGANCSTCNCNKEEKENEFVLQGTNGKKTASGKGAGRTRQAPREEEDIALGHRKDGASAHGVEESEESEDGPLEFREEFRFNNGAVYK